MRDERQTVFKGDLRHGSLFEEGARGRRVRGGMRKRRRVGVTRFRIADG